MGERAHLFRMVKHTHTHTHTLERARERELERERERDHVLLMNELNVFRTLHGGLKVTR